MGKIIKKKILPEYFWDVVTERKTFELRRDEDNAQAGDILLLQEHDGGHYTGRQVYADIIYVLRDVPEYGLQNGYCILGIQSRCSRKEKLFMQKIDPKIKAALRMKFFSETSGQKEKEETNDGKTV